MGATAEPGDVTDVAEQAGSANDKDFRDMTHSPLKKAVRSYAASYGVPYVAAQNILHELTSSGHFSLHWFKRRLADDGESVWPPSYSPRTYRAMIAKSEQGSLGRTVTSVSGKPPSITRAGHASPRLGAREAESESLQDLAGLSLDDLREDLKFEITAFRENLLRQIERPRINL
ncbi:hypothetical protein Ari01nite_97460 [Paractinoplanes rishiriensis]|uniref:Uncharacterized protein n=1 Tax=Paractinoplanes rishiriensis TaxID=1050105 RepID=A0A919KDD4_9ACTN|nr:hypothetical protein Ari01nite_97460 [Actinoplanes rishiriensis]